MDKQKRYWKSVKNLFFIFVLIKSSLILFPNCGKREAEGRTVGTVAGATIGAAVAGKNSKGKLRISNWF